MQETIHEEFFSNFLVATATISALYDIPSRPGIYAFYHAFDFSEDCLLESINERVSNTVFNTLFLEDKTGKKFTIDLCGEPVVLSDTMTKFISNVSLL